MLTHHKTVSMLLGKARRSRLLTSLCSIICGIPEQSTFSFGTYSGLSYWTKRSCELLPGRCSCLIGPYRIAILYTTSSNVCGSFSIISTRPCWMRFSFALIMRLQSARDIAFWFVVDCNRTEKLDITHNGEGINRNPFLMNHFRFSSYNRLVSQIIRFTGTRAHMQERPQEKDWWKTLFG